MLSRLPALVDTYLPGMVEGDHAVALEFYEEALALREAIGDVRGRRNKLICMTRTLRGAGELVRAESLLTTVVALDEGMGHHGTEADREDLPQLGDDLAVG